MSQSNFQRIDSPSNSHEMLQTRRRLIQEINCLEKQLQRLQQYNHHSSHLSTCKTYEEMIASRQEMLDSLSL